MFPDYRRTGVESRRGAVPISSMTRTTRIALALAGTAVIAVAGYAALMVLRPDWTSWRPATCMPHRCFCEAIRAGLVRQPTNSTSSLAFVMAGLLVLITGNEDRRKGKAGAAIHGLGGYPLVYAAALIVVGIGSAFYHASLSFAGQFADVMGMYLIATFVILYSYGRITPFSNQRVVIAYVAANASLALALVLIPGLRRYLFAVVLLVGLGIEYRARARIPKRLDGKILRNGVAVLAAGFAIWIIDITKVTCHATGVIQGHAIWHLAGAYASAQLYFYYRSEQSSI